MIYSGKILLYPLYIVFVTLLTLSRSEMSVEALNEILPTHPEDRKAALTFLARLAENTERYVDMCFYMSVRFLFREVPILSR